LYHPPRRRKRRNPALANTAARAGPCLPDRLGRHGAAPPPAPAGIDRSAVGFWVGGFVLGVTGCVVGACMPYRHPLGVLCSALWWGVYLGCTGGSIVSLACWLTQRHPPAEARKRSKRAAGAPAAPAAPAVWPEGYRSRFTGASRGGQELRIK
jgi:hypothetical protein